MTPLWSNVYTRKCTDECWLVSGHLDNDSIHAHCVSVQTPQLVHVCYGCVWQLGCYSAAIRGTHSLQSLSFLPRPPAQDTSLGSFRRHRATVDIRSAHTHGCVIVALVTGNDWYICLQRAMHNSLSTSLCSMHSAPTDRITTASEVL